jgi:hypothetical protein
MQFTHTLKDGHYVESKVKNYFEYLSYSVTHCSGSNLPYDLIIEKNVSTKTVEVKKDDYIYYALKDNRSANFCLELFNPKSNKVSGLKLSYDNNVDVWIHCIPKLNICYIFNLKTLYNTVCDMRKDGLVRDFVNKKENNATGWLLPLKLIHNIPHNKITIS